MQQTSGARLRELIDDLTHALAAASGAEPATRQLRQALALLHAAAETLDELAHSSVVKKPPARIVGSRPL